MSDNIWKLLQIEPTADQTQIKRAYAKQSKIFHPEEDPEGFLRLREAYSRALQWAELHENEEETPLPLQTKEPVKEEKTQDREPSRNRETTQNRTPVINTETPQTLVPVPDTETPQDRKPNSEETYTPRFLFRQSPDGPNPYRESEAHRAFLSVYKKENQKNWKLWMEYITSPIFLSVFHEEDFCALIEETVRQKEAEFRPGQEFIKSLYIAYCFTAADTGGYDGNEKQRRFHQEQGSFTVPEPVYAIARRYPIPRRMTGNDYTMKAGFINYYHLKSLSEGIGWTDQGLSGLRLVLERYVSAYIKDNYTGDQMTEFARHPLSIRLLNYFFDTEVLNAECYRTAWEVLDLKQAVMGRNKLLYGSLREICLRKYPGLNEEEPESFFELNRDCTAYFERSYARLIDDPRQEESDAEASFNREDLKRALHNRTYVEKNVLNHWISSRRSPAFLRRLRAFYEAEPTLPCARQVLQRIGEAEESGRIFRQNTEDTEAPASDKLVSVNYRPFLRYWLNTAFRDFQELKLYLQEQLPYSPEWAKKLLNPEEDLKEAPVSRRILLDGAEIEVRMHLYYAEYRMNGQEMFRPFLPLPYQKIKALETEELLLLLPMALPADDGTTLNFYGPDEKKLAKRLQERLAETALPPENQAKAAEYLSRELTQRFRDMKNMQAKGCGAVLPLRIYLETPDTLYCAMWRQDDRAMCLYMEQGQEGMRRLSAERYDFIEKETQAADLGRELLSRLIAPPPIDCSCMEKLPETVFVSRPLTPVNTLRDEDITIEALNGLLEQFAAGELNRLEFSFAPYPWELKAEEVESYFRKRALVFLKTEAQYSCFYFDDTKYIFFALMKRIDSVGTAGDEFVSLTHRNLPNQCAFTSSDSIRCNLAEILRRASKAEISLEKNRTLLLNNCTWRAAWSGVFIKNRREKYNLAKQELGGFPLERAFNSERQPVILDRSPEALNRQPLSLEWRTQDGTVKSALIDGAKTPLFSETMKQFFQGNVVWLRLSWDVSPDDYRQHFASPFFENILARRTGRPMQSHIILRRDGDRYTMLCLQDLAERAVYYVADTRTYMGVEGKKYPKDSFLGRPMPAYLIHSNPIALRNRLDLLLDNMECMLPVTDRFAEFAPESPVKARDYDTIREEFVKETV